MPTIRYTLCRFFPDRSSSSDAYEFAVFAAGASDIALIGVNLESYGLSSDVPPMDEVYAETFDLVARELDKVCKVSKAESGYALLDEIVGRAGMTCFGYSRIEEIQSAEETTQASFNI